MASLQEIKGRLTSVTTTKKITKAMELVATAKLQKAKKGLNLIQDYFSSVYDMFQHLLSNVKDVAQIMPASGTDATLYILVSSDIGLCGGYNANMVRMIKSEFRSGQDVVTVIGNKGVSAAKINAWTVKQQFTHVGDRIDYFIAAEIGKSALAMFMAGQVNRVKIIYTKFVNTVTFEATSLQLLPIVVDSAIKNTVLTAVTEFEPSPEVVLRNAMPLYISALVYGAVVESKVSEMSSRRTAMENATDNADQLIDALDLDYNRRRQANITQEISEIVDSSGA